MLFCDLVEKHLSKDIGVIFPHWQPGDERVAIMSPHDDDALIGAGYAALAALRHRGQVFVMVFSQGEAGYSKPEQKDRIVEIRRKETEAAYGLLDIPRDHIIRLEYSDFSVLEQIGWKLINQTEGSFRTLVTLLRRHRITRVIVPNHHREHVDHTAVFTMGAFHTPQAGDPVCVDWGQPFPCRGVLQYSVWADFSPEDSLVRGTSPDVRVDRAIVVPEAVEEQIRRAIAAYRSQGEIIKGLVAAREERRTAKGYLELYRTFDPRPKLDFKPYVDLVNNMRE